MANYITYQCSICRRSKDVLKDDNRALPNMCIITKGCQGRIFPINEKTFIDPVIPLTGITDWFPKGKEVSEIKPQTPQQSDINLSTSKIGTLTLAVRGVQIDKVHLKVLERKIEDIDFQQYFYKLDQPTNTIPSIGGSIKRDIYGKLLVFDEEAINDGRVMVLVNGVARFEGSSLDDLDSISPNNVSFNKVLPAGTVISVLVYAEKDVQEKNITFLLNSTKRSRYGSWANVSAVRDLNFYTGPVIDSWYVYTCETVTTILPNSRLKIVSLNNTAGTVLKSGNNLTDVRFLLASEPFSSADRYYNFIVDTQILRDSLFGYSIGEGIIKLGIEGEAVTEIFPPLKIYPSDFLSQDIVNLDAPPTDVNRLQGNKILGPI